MIAVDGKTVRGAKGKDGKAPYLVAALAHGIGAVLGQVAVDARSNEIPAVRELLKAFADLTGAVVTMDALHAQHDTARAVLDRRADYVMTVKANTPTLYAQLKKLPWKNVPGFSHVAKDHGRRTRRTVKAALAPWIQEHWHIENKLRQASKTLRRFTTLQLRCGSGPGACSTWRQRLSC